MQKKVLEELKELRSVIAKLIGTADIPATEQFSSEALSKAAKEFQRLSIERGEWIAENEISKCIKGAGWGAGKFIRKEFGFANFIKRGHTYYYYKKDLLALASELKKRNVDLDRYIEFKRDKADFEKRLSGLKIDKKKKDKPSYFLPVALSDITTSAPPLPSVELIRKDIDRLKEEFFQDKLSEYIDVYENGHAMMKFIYHFEKYIESGIKRRCKKWCSDFNYANHALELVTKKRETFVPVREEDMIQL